MECKSVTDIPYKANLTLYILLSFLIDLLLFLHIKFQVLKPKIQFLIQFFQFYFGHQHHSMNNQTMWERTNHNILHPPTSIFCLQTIRYVNSSLCWWNGLSWDTIKCHRIFQSDRYVRYYKPSYLYPTILIFLEFLLLCYIQPFESQVIFWKLALFHFFQFAFSKRHKNSLWSRLFDLKNNNFLEEEIVKKIDSLSINPSLFRLSIYLTLNFCFFYLSSLHPYSLHITFYNMLITPCYILLLQATRVKRITTQPIIFWTL